MAVENTAKKQKNSFVQRSTTAAAFVTIMLACVYFGAASFTFIFALVTVLCLWELLTIFFPKDDWAHKLLGLALGLLPYSIAVLSNFDYLDFSPESLLWGLLAILFSLFIIELFLQSKQPFQNIALLILAAIYVSLPFALLHTIGFAEGDSYYFGIVMGLMLMTWASDTGAYLVGSRFGKTPFLPRISPKKTWEGTLGGLLGTVLAGWGLSVLLPELPRMDWIALACIVGVFGPLGDLVESMLKRSYGIKDSSNLLPGHGGVLDRFDAFLFMLPFVAVYLFLIR